MPNWMPSLYPGGRARLIPRRTSFNASRRSAGSAARYSVTVDAGMGRGYHEGFCRGNCNVRTPGKREQQHAHTLQSMTGLVQRCGLRAGAAGTPRRSADWKARAAEVMSCPHFAKYDRLVTAAVLRIHAELDAFLVS